MPLSFDGLATRVECGVSGLLANNAVQSITWWTRFPSLPGGIQNMFSIISNPAGSAIQPGFRPGPVRLGVWKFGGAFLVSIVPPPPAVATWHSYAYTFDGTTHRFYIDGLLVASSVVAPQTAVPLDFRLGHWSGGGEFYNGILDDIRYYSRLISANEIATIHNCRGVDGIVTSLQRRIMLEEQAPGVIAVGAGTVKDAAQQQQNGSPSFSPVYSEGELRYRRKVS
jgi:hypothetical protein